MKKNIIIIRVLFLLVTTTIGGLIQAQQQKPSERSFAAEVNKIKEKQAARNAMIRRMQQPTGNTTTPTNTSTEQQVKLPAATSGSNTNLPQQSSQPAIVPSTQQQSGTKPSAGAMRQPPQPRVQQ